MAEGVAGQVAEEFEVDLRYEFDAPKHYDFKRMSQGDSHASDWFFTRDSTKDDASSKGAVKEAQAAAPTLLQSQQEDPKRKSNIVTSWGAAVQKKTPTTGQKRSLGGAVLMPSNTAANNPAGTSTASKQPMVLKAPVMPAASAAKANAAKLVAIKPNAHTTAKPAAKPAPTRSMSAPRASTVRNTTAGAAPAAGTSAAAGAAAATEASKAAALQRTSSRMGPPKPLLPGAAAARTVTAETRVAAAAPRSISAPPARPQLALPDYELPVTRSVAKRKAAEARPLTRSFAKQLEPLKLKLLDCNGLASSKVEHSKPKAQPALSLQQVLQPVKLAPVRSTKPLTLPEDVELHTSKRHRTCGPEQVGSDQQAKEDSHSPWKSMAQKVKEFQSKTPARFRSKPAPLEQPKTTARPQITDAREPLLWTSTRARPSAFKPREQEEQELMASMPTFHAKPVSASILKGSGKLSLAKLDKRAITEPQPFNFITDSRAAAKKQPTEEEVEDAKKDSEAKHWRDERGFTIAKSPLLRTKHRVHDDKTKQQEEPRYQFRARGVPDFTSGPKLGNKRSVEPKELTQPQPFQLRTELRGSQHQAHFSERLQQQEEQEHRARRVHAQGLPLSTDMPIIPPKPQAKGLTMPEPFELRSEARHSQYQLSYMEQLQAEEADRRAKAEFKAQPIWDAKPFQPQPSDAPLTMPEEVHLATDTRAHEREEFDEQIRQKWQQVEAEKMQREEERKRREEAEKRAFRKSIRFEARPMPDFSQQAFGVAPSRKRLTNPQSPKLATSKRHKTT